MGIGKKICICKEYLRLEAKCNVISTGNNNTVCPCHSIEEVSSEATETTRTTVGLRRVSVFLLMCSRGSQEGGLQCSALGRRGFWSLAALQRSQERFPVPFPSPLLSFVYLY